MAEPAAATLVGVFTHPHRPPVLQDVSLTLLPGEILTLLGDAEAATSALLRLLAGFEHPAAGEVLLGGQDARLLPPRRRGVGLVEPGLGLFRHLTVARSIALAARPPGRAGALLEAAGLAGAARMLPAELDAGQRAMLATARALAASPRVLLLDRTADGLDRTARETLFALIRGARAAGVAVLYATGDAAHAVALGDRMAVLADGGIRQEGRPQAIYDAPADATVAALTGPVNALPGQVQAETEEGVLVRLARGAPVEARAGGVAPGERCVVCLRPEHLAVSAVPPEQMGEGALPARVEWVTYHGDHLRVGLRAADALLVALRPAGAALRGIAAGRIVSVAWQAHHATAFPPIPGVI